MIRRRTVYSAKCTVHNSGIACGDGSGLPPANFCPSFQTRFSASPKNSTTLHCPLRKCTIHNSGIACGDELGLPPANFCPSFQIRFSASPKNSTTVHCTLSTAYCAATIPLLPSIVTVVPLFSICVAFSAPTITGMSRDNPTTAA